MSQPLVENTNILECPLDERSSISGIEAESAGCLCLSVILMSVPTAIPSKAEFDTVIGYVREVRAGFEQAVSGLDHPPTEAALGYANGMKAGLDTALITLEHLARMTGGAPEVAGSGKRRKHLLHICPDCALAVFPDTPHDCKTAGNGFTEADLDRLVGPDGYRLRWPDGSLEHDNEGIDPEPDTARVSAAASELALVAAPRPLGMREGSKKHRIYMATRKLLEANGPMHLDDLLERVCEMLPGVFSGVKDRRTNFANILSALRSKRLIESDNRGNYSLPHKKAAE